MPLRWCRSTTAWGSGSSESHAPADSGINGTNQLQRLPDQLHHCMSDGFNCAVISSCLLENKLYSVALRSWLMGHSWVHRHIVYALEWALCYRQKKSTVSIHARFIAFHSLNHEKTDSIQKEHLNWTTWEKVLVWHAYTFLGMFKRGTFSESSREDVCIHFSQHERAVFYWNLQGANVGSFKDVVKFCTGSVKHSFARCSSTRIVSHPGLAGPRKAQTQGTARSARFATQARQSIYETAERFFSMLQVRECNKLIPSSS